MNVQMIATAFLMGLVGIALALLVTNRTLFLYLMVGGVWLIIASAILYRMYGRTTAPKLSVSQKEQLVANLKALAS